MKEGLLYPQNAHNMKKTRKSILTVAITSCMLLLGNVQASARLANNVPSFTNGYLQTTSACQNATTSVNAQMTVTDLDHGQTETWTILAGPYHGTLSGFATTALSTGSTVTPSGLDYTPATGYLGNDTFTIQVFDGFDTASTNVIVTVVALPTLSSSLTPPDICDGSVFNYAPASTTPGAVFSWTRPFIGGISNPTASGSGNPMETLYNLTYYTVAATYNYTISGGGCINHQSVVVNVTPKPNLTSATSAGNICNGATFSYLPTGTIPATSFAWSRAAIYGITPATSSGTGSISEALYNGTSAPQDVVYTYVLNANGCSATRTVTVTVNPPLSLAKITTVPATGFCSGTNNQVFGADTPPASGVTYAWSASNATITAAGNSGQYVVVSFPAPGPATLILTSTITGSGCTGTDAVSVNVNSSVVTSDKVLYYNAQFIYMDNRVDEFQWGYDDAGTLASHDVAGAIFQSYPNNAPDFTNKYYWVKTKKSGCSQKTYFNAPMAVTNVNAAASVKYALYPNPADNKVTLELDNASGVVTDVVLIDNLGRILMTQSGTTQKFEFNTSNLATGWYHITCTQNGMKVLNTNFVKTNN